MHIEQLEYVIAVAKTGSISNAAHSLHVSTPGISQSISNLEKELGLKIFTRSRLGAAPTEKGKKIIKKAYDVLEQLQELREEAKAQKTSISGELKLAASPSLFTLLLRSTMAFKKDYPHVKIEITENTATEISQTIKSSKLDIGFVALTQLVLMDRDNLDFEKLLEAHRNVCVSKHSPLAYNDSIEPEELLNESLVVYSGGNMKKFIAEFFKHYGPMTILFESNQIEVIKKTVAEGLAISFFSDLLLKNDPSVLNGDIIALPLIDRSTPIPFGWIRSKHTPFSAAAKEFLKYLKRQVSQNNY